MNFDIAVVIVTYNRLQKLKNTLRYYDMQKTLPRHIIVVDNNSSDRTNEYLKNWQEKNSKINKHVITLNENLGGSGGFFIGEEYALQLPDVNWIMIADDDAYPEEDYIYGMEQFIKNNTIKNIAIVCGKVMENGSCVNVHRTYLVSRWSWDFHKFIPESEYKKTKIFPDFVSYVGIIINKEILKKAGLVDKDYFIWNDDTEHSYRIKKYGSFICLPQYTIYHDVAIENSSLSWKTYYSYRNKIVFFKRHFKLQFPFIFAITLIKALLCPLKGKTLTEAKLRIIGIKDGLIGNMGKNNYYKPGWKP